MKRKATSKSTGPQMASERPRRYLGDPAVGFVLGMGLKEHLQETKVFDRVFFLGCSVNVP